MFFIKYIDDIFVKIFKEAKKIEQITNQAYVTFSHSGSDTTRTNSSNIVSQFMKDKFSLSVEKTSTSTCFRIGDFLTYFISVKNTGCGCLSKFRLEDIVTNEEYVTFVENSAKLFINGSMTNIIPTSTSPLVFEIDSRLERDSELILQYVVTVNSNIPTDITEIVNRVDVSALPCSCDCNTNSESVSGSSELSIPKCKEAEVLITKAVSNDSICCGEEIDYILTLTNIGSVDATNVVVTDSLPENFTVMEIHKENNGNHYKYDSSEYTIDGANLLTLPNETGTIIEVPALAPGVDNTTRIRIHGHM